MGRLQARVLIACGDLFAIIVGIGAVALVRAATGHHDEVVHVLFAFVPLFFAVALYHHAYDRDVIFDWPCGYRRAVSALAVAFLGLVGMAFALKISDNYSRIIVLLGLLASVAPLAAARRATSFVSRTLLPESVADVAILVAGYDGGTGKLRGAAVIDAARHGLVPRLDDPEMLDRIGGVLLGCERVIVACAPDMRDAWTAVLKGLGMGGVRIALQTGTVLLHPNAY